MRILILGVNHQVQRHYWSSNKRALAFANDQKARFLQLVREIVRERSVEFVGEEANHNEESIIAVVAKEEGSGYANIEMPPEERDALKIPPGQAEDSAVSNAEKARGNREREKYMVDCALSRAKDLQSVLLICGRAHSQNIATQLKSLGHMVEVDDLLSREWYVEDWVNHVLNNLW